MVKKASTSPCVGKPKVRKPRKTRPGELHGASEAGRDEEKREDKKKRSAPKLFHKELSEVAGVETKDVKAVFDALAELVVTKLHEDGRFAIPEIVLLRVKDTKARPATTKKLFDKEVAIAAKPAGKRIRPLVLKPLKVALNAASE